MRVLALDFDGVTFDTILESFTVATETYRRFRGKTSLSKIAYERVRNLFRSMMVYGTRAEDYLVDLDLIANGQWHIDRKKWNQAKSNYDPKELHVFHQLFYQVRYEMMERNREAWAALIKPFPEVESFLKRSDIPKEKLALASNRDSRSVHAILSRWGLENCFGTVMDKNAGTSKVSHLTKIADKLGTDPSEVTLVDDKLANLESASKAGFKVAMAGWGYNTKEQQEEAQIRGWTVLEPGSFTSFAMAWLASSKSRS